MSDDWKVGDRCVLVTLNARDGDAGPHPGRIETRHGDKVVVVLDDGRRYSARLSSSFVQRPDK